MPQVTWPSSCLHELVSYLITSEGRSAGPVHEEVKGGAGLHPAASRDPAFVFSIGDRHTARFTFPGSVFWAVCSDELDLKNLQSTTT